MMEVLGGRKFLGFIISVVAGILIEIFGKNGLGANMVALLGAAYATFAASNSFVTAKTGEGSEQPASQPAEEPAPKEDSSAQVDISAMVTNQLNANNQQLAAILSQIGTELAKQQQADEKILEALNSVQASQSTVQKGLQIILSRGT